MTTKREQILSAITTSDYPCSLWQLRQENPNVSFPADPTDEDLALFGHANVHPTPQPNYDQHTERIEEGIPEPDAEGIYRQQWVIRDATPGEIADYDLANLPQPDWDTFKQSALKLTSLNTLIGGLATTMPIIAYSLLATLLDAETNNYNNFENIWTSIETITTIPAQLITELATLAETCHLPQQFINIFVM